jgi:hypothetical protein
MDIQVKIGNRSAMKGALLTSVKVLMGHLSGEMLIQVIPYCKDFNKDFVLYQINCFSLRIVVQF